MLHVDIPSCRRNVLWYSEEPWLLFGIHDRMEPIWRREKPCPLDPGLYYLDTPLEGQSTIHGDVVYDLKLPLCGRGWHTAATVRYCLERGLVSWDHIRYKCLANGLLPAPFFRPMLQRFEALAAALGEPKRAKHFYCAFIGALSVERSWRSP